MEKHKYNKTTDEIVAAATKHRAAALALKEACEKQKKKADGYKQQIEKLEFEAKDDEREKDDLKRKNNDLAKDIIRL